MLIDTSFTLYLIRHGLTQANIQGIRQGQTINLPLLPVGVKDAELTALRLQNMKWSLCYASDLERAWKTAEIIVSKCSTDYPPLRPSSILRELNFGLREGYPASYTLEEAKRQYAIDHNIHNDDVIDWAENEEEVTLRHQIMLDTIMRELHPKLDIIQNDNRMSQDMNSDNIDERARKEGSFTSYTPDDIINQTTKLSKSKKLSKNVLVVSHGGFIRKFLSTYCLDRPAGRISNCSISKVHVRYTNEDYEFTVKNEEDINSVDHLLVSSSSSSSLSLSSSVANDLI